MNPIEPTPELLKVAQAVVWFKEPSDALKDPIYFLAHAMTYGTDDDIRSLQNANIGLREFCEVLENPPSGVFDLKSWAYWNIKCGKSNVPPLPKRNLTLG